MPVKLSEDALEERKKKEAASKARKELRRKQYEPDFDPEGLLKQARNRVYRMKAVCEKIYEPGDPEYDLYESASSLRNKMLTAYKNAEMAKKRENAALRIRNARLVAEERTAWRAYFKDFVYYQFAIGQEWTEFLEETGSYGVHA